MIKQAVIIRYDDKPVMVLPITTFQSAEDYVKFEKECKKNYDDLLEKIKGIKDYQQDLIDTCLARIYKLKTELAYQKGEISEEEYQQLERIEEGE